MIKNFSDSETESVFNGIKSRKLPLEIQSTARRKLRMIEAATSLKDLRIPPGNHLEKLQGILNDYYSIRINDQWRIIFKYNEEGAANVRITDYH